MENLVETLEAPLFDEAWDAADVDLLTAWITEDSSDSAPSASSSSSPVSAESGEKTKMKRDSNTTRYRRREEIAYLHERVAALEAELSALRKRESSLVPPTGGESGASEWQAIAQRQQRAREKAELENYKLRTMLQSQLKLAQTLERLLQKREHAKVGGDGDGSTEEATARIPITDNEVDDATVFGQIVRSIDHAYTRTEAVLEENGLWTAAPGDRAVQIKTRAEDDATGEPSVYVELIDVNSMPFDLDAIAGAAWRCITGGYMQLDHEVYHGYDGHDHILAIKYAVTISRRRLHLDFTARAVMKRFVEADRVIDVWESVSDTAGNHATKGGLRVKERGWTVFQRSTEPGKTLVLTCMHMAPLISYGPKCNATAAEEDRQVGVLTNLALDYCGDQVDSARDAMESLLLDEARPPTRHSPLIVNHSATG